MSQPRKSTKISTWSRSGCVTCKQRRKKCDRGRPMCSNCASRGIPCGGYQQPFVSQVIRGVERPSESLSTLSGSEPGRVTWQPQQNIGHTAPGNLLESLDECLGAVDGNLEAICSLQDSQRTENEGVFDATPPETEWPLGSPQNLRAFPAFTTKDFYYIQYIHEQGARQLLNMDAGPFNPLRCLLLPRAFDSSGVLHALCAVAACHQAQRADPDQQIGFSVPATAFYLKATSWLRQSFDPGGEPREAGASVENSLLIALLLCKYEIIKGSVSHWKIHLHGLETLLKSCGGLGAFDPDFARYISSFMTYHRTVAGICDMHDWKPCDEIDKALKRTASPVSSSLDSYSGFADYLLRACGAISKLAGCVERQEIRGLPDLLVMVDSIVTSLGSPNIHLDAEIYPEGLSISQITRLLFVAQRIRYSAFVFLHAVLKFAQTAIPGFVGSSPWDEILSHIPYTKTQALDACFEMLAETPVGEFCEFAALTLPLFLAGCEVPDEKTRYVTIGRLFLMERSFGIGNIARARDALMTIWQHQNGGVKRKFWWKILQGMGWNLILS